MATEMDTIINSQQTIPQAMAITEIMDSMAIQAIDHKTISHQLNKIQATNTYLHRPINLNHNHHGPTISTFHPHKIKIKIKIAQMAMATVISIHKADTDTKAAYQKLNRTKPQRNTHNIKSSPLINNKLQLGCADRQMTEQTRTKHGRFERVMMTQNNSFRLCTIPLNSLPYTLAKFYLPYEYILLHYILHRYLVSDYCQWIFYRR